MKKTNRKQIVVNIEKYYECNFKIFQKCINYLNITQKTKISINLKFNVIRPQIIKSENTI